MASTIFWEASLVALALVAVRRLLHLYNARRNISHLPGGQFLWIDPFRTTALVLAPIFPLAGWIGDYYGKFSLYKHYGSTCLTSVRLWNSQIYYWLADADALKSVTSDRYTFQKDVEAYEALNVYGDNLIGTESLDWKRHRAVAKPAFNEANNALVWSETIRVINEWFHHLESTRSLDINNQDIPLDVVTAMTQATLLVISSAGFGRSVSWASDSDSSPPPGHALSFRSAVTSTTDNIFVKILAPSWLINLSAYIRVPYLSQRLKETEIAFEELRSHLIELISYMRADVADGKKSSASGLNAALLRNLVEANMGQDGDTGHKQLTDEELLSNVFTFLLAGHETSAHTLSFAIPLLALYPETQRKIFDEVSQIWPHKCPTESSNSLYKEDYPKLEYTTAFFRETLRLFPSEPRLAKPVHADAMVTARRFTPPISSGGEYTETEVYQVPIPKGSVVIMDIHAANLNPLHWGGDADDFKPERFIDTETYRWPRDAFLSFSAGARGCIGSRFAMAESVCILALLVRRYEILVPSDLKSLPFAAQKSTLLKWGTGVTITPTESRVRLRRRI